MTFTPLDIVIIAVVAFSGVVSLFRGFTSELLSLATWAIAFILPFHYTEQFSAFLPESVESPSARWVISAGVLFFGALFFCAIISFMIRKIVGAVSLGFADRLMGVILGLARGVLIVAVVALIGTSNPAIPKERLWNESKLLPPVLKISNMIHNRLPASFAKWFKIKSL